MVSIKGYKNYCALLLFFTHFVFGYDKFPWGGGHIWILGDSHGVYCFTNNQNQIPWPNHMPKEPEVLYEQSQFNYQMDNGIIAVPLSIYWLQGRTMHRVGRDGLIDFNIKKFGVKEDDTIVLVFGSIDRDRHVIRGSENILRQMIHRDTDEIIDTLCKNYIETVLLNKNQYKNITVVIMGLVPPYMQRFMDQLFLQVFPEIRSESVLSMQVQISKKINQKLKEYCAKNHLLFLDIQPLFESPKGDLNYELSAGDHHIHPKYNCIIKNELLSLLMDAYVSSPG